MAYTTATLNCIGGGVGSCPQLWVYTTTDAHTDVDAADYFSDGTAKGMKVNDVVIVVDTDTNTCTTHMVSAVGATAATIAAATLS
jgi:hypothetical protein